MFAFFAFFVLQLFLPWFLRTWILVYPCIQKKMMLESLQLLIKFCGIMHMDNDIHSLKDILPVITLEQTENVVDDNRCSRGSMHVSNLHRKLQAPSTIMLEKLYAYARVPLVVPRSHETTFAADHPRSCSMQLFHSERKWLFLLWVVGVELVQ